MLTPTRTRTRLVGISQYLVDGEQMAATRVSLMLLAFTAVEAAVFGLAGAWLFLSARLSGQGESEEAVVIFFVGVAPMVGALWLGSVIAIVRAARFRKTAPMGLIASGGVLSGVFGVLGLFLLSQTFLLRGDQSVLRLVSAIAVSGLTGFGISSVCAELLLRLAGPQRGGS